MTMQFYFVCDRCTAKFFQSYDAACCPRCGARLHSTEKLTPPWEVRHAKALRRAEIFLFSRGLHPLTEPLLLQALSDFFLRKEDTHEASAAE